MLLYFITCFSFVIFLNSLLQKPSLPPWASEMRLLSLWFWKDLSFFSISRWIKNHNYNNLNIITQQLSLKKMMALSLSLAFPSSMVVNDNNIVEENEEMSILELPELVLECILERLPPSGLNSMAGVCTSLRERCTSDHLWERHMKHKWGRIIGPAAYREWQWYLASRKDSSNLKQGSKQKLWTRLISIVQSFLSIRSKVDDDSCKQRKNSLSVDSIMSKYLALETGQFWFPAQVYNRENGHVGFMLSCYDAELSYDLSTDTFQARYPPHGRRSVAIEHGVPWERLRPPPVDTSPHDLHVSNCLNELHPGDHIEIQWRRNKEFPYGWWYGIIGHLESCDGNEYLCHCHNSDTVVLEFNQYTPGSRWRKTIVNRKDHREEGNEVDGFYGGIRKLKTEEISVWKRLWPTDVLE